MESLPDDVLHEILQKGIQAGQLSHVDLCSFAIVNSRFDQLTQDPALWATLLSRDYHFNSFEAPPSKAFYRRWHSNYNIFTTLRIEREFETPNTIIKLRRLLSEIQFISEGLSASRHQLNQSGPLHDEQDPVLPDTSQPSLKQACNHYYENKPSKRFDKSSRPKVIPNCKSYIPMSRPPRRSMPRKI